MEPAKKGLIKGCHTVLLLMKIVIPVTFILVAFEQLEWLHLIADFFNPYLKILNLPGEAAIALLLGFFINIYAAIGALTVLSLSSREITVIALMILTCHSLPMESSVLKLTGIPYTKSIGLRVGAAIVFGIVLNFIYQLMGVL
jgi:hypothetical protein